MYLYNIIPTVHDRSLYRASESESKGLRKKEKRLKEITVLAHMKTLIRYLT
jgi:hypothetical protein